MQNASPARIYALVFGRVLVGAGIRSSGVSRPSSRGWWSASAPA
jgi:hypothetical protein